MARRGKPKEGVGNPLPNAAQTGLQVLILAQLMMLGAGCTAQREAEVFSIADLQLEFVSIPPGEFVRGLDGGAYREQPAHRVRITRPFELGRYEVTQAQWEAVMGYNPSHFKGADRPVESVSWNEVQQFIQKLNDRQDGYTYRLPTEAEWEFACRAGTTGNYAGDLESMAWCGLNAGGQTHPVGQKEPNAWGLYDMHGNVWEWVEDWFGRYPDGDVDDPRGAPSGEGRVFRGGSWAYGYPSLCRSGYRNQAAPDRGYFVLGFRLARFPAPDSAAAARPPRLDRQRKPGKST